MVLVLQFSVSKDGALVFFRKIAQPWAGDDHVKTAKV
jgi:hypothetical protein